VALGNINHSRAQDRFLSGWKKRTYSETEDIDSISKFLTNSLEPPDKTAERRPSLSLPPPVTTPILVKTPDLSTNMRRRRRIGQVESPQFSESSDKDEKLSFGGTPGTNMDNIERHITNLERRKSVCEGSRSPAKRKTPSPTQKLGMINMLPPPHVNLPSDEERFDDSVSMDDMVRRISVTDLNVNRKARTVSPDVSEISELSESNFIENSDAEFPIVSQENRTEECCSGTVECVTNVNELQEFRNEIKSVETIVPADEHSESVIGKLETNSEREQDEQACDNACSTKDEEDADSTLWARTQALVSTQSFNLVRRRVSESN